MLGSLIFWSFVVLGLPLNSCEDANDPEEVEDGFLVYFPFRLPGYKDNPKNISSGLTTPSRSTRMSYADMEYYNIICAAMYCSDRLRDMSCTLCKSFKDDVDKMDLIYNSTAGTIALFIVSEGRQEIIITFRGSNNDINMADDANTDLMKFTDKIYIHEGFFKATMSLYHTIVDAIKSQHSQSSTNYTIVANGHSLGGSMAAILIFLMDYNKDFPGVNYKLVGYGEPRVGNMGFANYMNNLTITAARVVNNADASVHFVRTDELNSTDPNLYYVHRQPEWWIQKKVYTWCNTSYYEDPNCSNSLGPDYLWKNHMHILDVNYIDCMVQEPLEKDHTTAYKVDGVLTDN